jgi:post-segregation antitoxin (ccd killing protein)
MGTKVNACLYLDRKVLETAKQMGLNISKVSENALKEAIGWLSSLERETGPDNRTRTRHLNESNACIHA